MSMNYEEGSINRKEPELQRLPYHAPRLASLGSIHAVVQLGDFPGSDGGPGTDCAFGA
jgi:hypothetical protein